MNTSNMKRAKPLHQFYTDKVAALTAEIAELKRHNTTFVLAELAAFVAMLALRRLLLHPSGGCGEKLQG